MTICADGTTPLEAPAQLVGGWEVSLLILMALLYAVGVFLNPISSAVPTPCRPCSAIPRATA